MRRRTFLELCAGIALAARPSAQSLLPSRKVVVAGAGIIGASIALQLSKRGAAVTLLDKLAPASGATANSFAWINAKKSPRDYFNLNRLGIHAWRQLDQELGNKLPVTWGGGLEWGRDPQRAKAYTDRVRSFQGWGYAVHLIDEQRLRALEPQLVPGTVASAAHWEEEGQIDPVLATQVLVAEAVKAGARVVNPCEVTGLDIRSDQLRAVRTTRGEMEADVLVLACGADTGRVASLAGITVPLIESPGVLVHTMPMPRLVQRVVYCPLGHFKQKPDGRIVVGSEGENDQQTREAGQKVLANVSEVFPALAKASVDKVTLGHRPLPKDGRPVVGFPTGRRDIYVTVMHSGVTLSALIGRLAAAEILDDARVDVLAPYRIERFNSPAV